MWIDRLGFWRNLWLSMTTAARPTWAPAKGGNEQGGARIFGPSQKYSSRDIAAHTTLKRRFIVFLFSFSNILLCMSRLHSLSIGGFDILIHTVGLVSYGSYRCNTGYATFSWLTNIVGYLFISTIRLVLKIIVMFGIISSIWLWSEVFFQGYRRSHYSQAKVHFFVKI